MTARAEIQGHAEVGWWRDEGQHIDLAEWVPAWVRWRVRCTARRTNGLPCQAWSIRGGQVCVVHGGAAPQVRQAAADRLSIERWESAVTRLLRKVDAWGWLHG